MILVCKLLQSGRSYLILFMMLGGIFNSLSQATYYDASQFPLIGKIMEDTETRYERLPAYLQSITRPEVWSLGKNTYGYHSSYNFKVFR